MKSGGGNQRHEQLRKRNPTGAIEPNIGERNSALQAVKARFKSHEKAKRRCNSERRKQQGQNDDGGGTEAWNQNKQGGQYT